MMQFIRSPMNPWKVISPLLLVCLFFSSFFGAQPVAHAQNNSLIWSKVAGLPATAGLHDVFMVNQQVAWIVGEDRGAGVIYKLKLQGERWEASFEQSFPAPLYAVVATSENKVWAVGDQGIIVHKDQSDWRMVSGPTPGVTLKTIQMFGTGEEGWAGGYFPVTPERDMPQPALFHYQGGAWKLEPSVNGPGMIEQLHFTSGAGWAAGDGLWRYAAGRWTREEDPFACGDNFPCPRTFEAVRAISTDEAWAVGSRHAICAACVTRPHVVHRVNGSWQRDVTLPTGSTNPQSTGAFTGMSFSSDGVGLLVGWYDRGIIDPVQGIFDRRTRPMIARYQNQQWHQESLPADVGALMAISMIDSTHALAVGGAGLILAYGYGAQPDPHARVGNPGNPDVLYFEPVGHTLKSAFRHYWERNGGLDVFGYPLTEAFQEINSDTGQAYLVQYLERQRYEYHPQLSRTPYVVLLGRLGVEALQRQGRDWTTFRKGNPAAKHYFAETGHAIAPEFWDYWRSHGLHLDNRSEVTMEESLALFGFPVSEPEVETNSSGDRVLTQWFERARFEYHPNNPQPHRILLGRLAAEISTNRSW